jgi:hypothetical protein
LLLALAASAFALLLLVRNGALTDRVVDFSGDGDADTSSTGKGEDGVAVAEQPQALQQPARQGRQGTFERSEVAAKPLVVLDEHFDDAELGPYRIGAAEEGWSGFEFVRHGFGNNRPAVAQNPDGDGRVLEVEVPPETILKGVHFEIALPDMEEAILRYRVRFPPDFDFSKGGGKLPGLSGAAPGVYRPPMHCSAVTGLEGFSARHTWHRGGRLAQYLYHVGKEDNCGDKTWLSDRERVLQPATWHEIVQRVKMNDVGENNGIVETWVDGELAASRDDLILRSTDAFAVNRLTFDSYFGGKDAEKWGHDQREIFHFDDFAVWTFEDAGR